MRWIAVLSLLALLACGSQNQPDNPSADTPAQSMLFYNAQIVTMDPENPIAEAMVVDGQGRISWVGKNVDIPSTPEIPTRTDMSGRVILPGIIDSHVHVRELGADLLKADLVGSETVAEIVTRLQAFYPNPEPGQWLVGQGWDEGAWASKGYPDRAELDAAFPDNPLHLESLHGFAGFYNGAALKVAGITKDTPNPEVGQILRRENGEPSGVMLTLAQGLVNRHKPEPSLAQAKEAVKAGALMMARAGVTAVHEAGMDPLSVQAMTELDVAGELPLFIYGLLNGNDTALVDAWIARGSLLETNGRLTIGGFKVFYDGSLGSRTALLAEPYSDKPHEANMTERISPEAMKELAAKAAKARFQMAVHAIGDEGNNRTMAIFEEALAPYPDYDHRWRIEHAQVVLPDFYPRAAKMGVIASMQPSHAVSDSKWAEDRLGSERIQHAYAWQKMDQAGVPIVFNSDLPGEPWEPMLTLYFALTRQNVAGVPEGGWYPEEALSPEKSLHAMTVAGAHAAYAEDQMGMLKAGLWANFITLDGDPRTIAPKSVKDINILSTWIQGKEVQ